MFTSFDYHIYKALNTSTFLKKPAPYSPTILFTKLLLLFSFFFLCLLSNPVYAYKLETHVWISQQVINDATDDMHLTIEPFGEFKVNQDLYNAMLQYPNEFRMGSIGPDGFPDLIGGQLTVHPGVPTGWKTDDWLKMIIEAPSTLKQKAFAYGFLTHAAADTFAHTYVNTYAGDYFILTDEQEVELRHMALEEYIKDHTPPTQTNSGTVILPHQSVSAPAVFIRDKLLLNPSVVNQYRKQTTTAYLAGMYDYWKNIGIILNEIEQIKTTANEKINAIQSVITGLENDINDLKDITVSVFGKTVNLYPYYCAIDPGTCALILSTEATLAVTRGSLEVPRAALNMTVSSLEYPIKNWQGQVEEALLQYIITSQEIVKEIMKPNGNPTQKLQDWVCEWGPVFAGIPSQANYPVCATINGIARAQQLHDDIHVKFNQAIDLIDGNSTILNWMFDPYYAVEQLKDDLKTRFISLGVDIANNLIATDSLALDLINFRLETQTSAKMDGIFSADSSNKNLVNFANTASQKMSARITADMHVSGGYFDPEKFNAIRNAVTLSKLAMLDASQLNLLVKRAGITGTIFGTDLYSPDTFVNVLYGSLGSIDGNHQWQEYPLPYPRISGDGISRDDSNNPESFGYSYSSSKGGFRLWQDCEVRDQVFKRIFKGPIAPAIELPASVGLTNISGYNNPTNVSASNRFPLSSLSSLQFKALTDDGSFNFNNWLQIGDLSNLLTYDSAYVSTSYLTSVSLIKPTYSTITPLNSPKRLVLDLKAQACGGSLAEGGSGDLSTRWAFTKPGGCTYTCTCTAAPYCYIGPDGVLTCPPNSCSCNSTECGSIPKKLTSLYEVYEYGLSPADNQQCGLCHTGPELQVGTWLLKSKFAPGIPAGDGIEFEGSKICNVTASQTKLVMPAVASKNIYMEVTENQTGARSIANITKSTNIPSLVAAYPDWQSVDQHFKTISGDTEDACGVINIADAGSFEADTVPPTLTIPDDIVMSCGELRQLESDDKTVLEIIGNATVTDNRDPDVTLSNNAPASIPVGITSVTWVATDDAGHTVSQTQTVTVTDDIAPVFNNTAPLLTVTATNPSGTSVNIASPIAVDACEGNIVGTTATNLLSMPVGTSTIIWTASDSSDNQSQIIQDVKVQAITGDLNIDGLVNAADLIIFNNDLDTLVQNNQDSRDYNNDGTIDDRDQDLMQVYISSELEQRDYNNDSAINELDARLLLGLISPNTGLDEDNDTIFDVSDNCVSKANTDQADLDGDGLGTVCDFNGDIAPPPPSNNSDSSSLHPITLWIITAIILLMRRTVKSYKI